MDYRVLPEYADYSEREQDQQEDEEIRATACKVCLRYTYILNRILHAKMVKATTTMAVIAVAVKTISGFVNEQIIPIKSAKISVKIITMGNANLLKKSLQHPITIDMANNRTERMMTETVFPNIFLNDYDFMAQTHTSAVIINWMLRIVYTFLINPARESW